MYPHREITAFLSREGPRGYRCGRGPSRVWQCSNYNDDDLVDDDLYYAGDNDLAVDDDDHDRSAGLFNGGVERLGCLGRHRGRYRVRDVQGYERSAERLFP